MSDMKQEILEAIGTIGCLILIFIVLLSMAEHGPAVQGDFNGGYGGSDYLD